MRSCQSPGRPLVQSIESSTVGRLIRLSQTHPFHRRGFLQSAAGLGAGLLMPQGLHARTPPAAQTEKQVAAIVTNYRRYSHADNIVTRFMEGYSIAGKSYPPPCRVASLYIDQVGDTDIGRPLARWWEVPLVNSPAEALTLGGQKLAVDGVLLIAEHGEYPINERGQKLYPRRELFEEIVKVFRASGRSVPVYCDKHLSYSWEHAKWMYDQSQELSFPFMAGSSVPVAYRRPDLRPPTGVKWDSVLALGHGDFEVYGFHALEALQVMAERRLGGETGVSAVQCLGGQTAWQAMGTRWDRELLEAALTTVPNRGPGPIEEEDADALVYCIDYRDGPPAAVYMSPKHAQEFAFAGRIAGEKKPAACWYELPKPQRDHFSFLVQNIASMFATGLPTVPVERTLLTTGMLAALMESKADGGTRVETPHLDVKYSIPASAP